MTNEKPLQKIRMYTLKEIVEISGVSYRTLQNYVKDGKIKAVKIGNKWRVTEDNLRAFLNGTQQN